MPISLLLQGFPQLWVCVHVSVCFSWMLLTGGLSPTWFSQKLNWLQRAARWPLSLSLSLSFHPSLLSGTFMHLFSRLPHKPPNTHSHSHVYICRDSVLRCFSPNPLQERVGGDGRWGYRQISHKVDIEGISVHTWEPAKGAVRHAAGCPLQVVLVQQLQLVLVAVFYVPSRAWTNRAERRWGRQPTREERLQVVSLCLCFTWNGVHRHLSGVKDSQVKKIWTTESRTPRLQSEVLHIGYNGCS